MVSTRVLKSLLVPAAATALVIGTGLPALAHTPAAPATKPVVGAKVTICHRTNSTTNPYRLITVDEASVDGLGNGDHFASHTGPVWDPSQRNGGDWGDIIPPIAGVHAGLNWTAEGRLFWEQGCVAVILGDTDADNVPNYQDPDDDNDGIPDATDPDDDNDGIPDPSDDDTNDNGVPDQLTPDADQDGTPDVTDRDDDNDGTPDNADRDRDNDGITDDVDPDSDADGTLDLIDPDRDDDGVLDDVDKDDDNDGTPDTSDADDDNDGVKDIVDPDSPPSIDPTPKRNPDSDSDGTPDSTDRDDDNDTITDPRDPDSNGDGVVETDDQRIIEHIDHSVKPGDPVRIGPSRMHTTVGVPVAVWATCTSRPMARSVPSGDFLPRCVATVARSHGRIVLRVTGAPRAQVTVHLYAAASGGYRPLHLAIPVRVA